MHDKVFAREIIEVIAGKLAELGKEGEMVCANVRLSPFSHVKPQTLREAFSLQAQTSGLKKASLNINLIEIEVKCRSCGRRFLLTSPLLCCRECQSTDLEVTPGPEFFVESLEIGGESRNE